MSARKNTVRADLTPSRRRSVENKAFAGFARRVIRAFSRRVATGDVEALTDLLKFAADLDDAIQDAVVGLREHGYSWSEIAQRAGIRKQTACERWGSKRKPAVTYSVNVSAHSEMSGGEF
ncbi:hypothetical protein Rhe02_61620 [Rhizocola hellebori]|uniref:Uncharacterized protein n=1 Tax=Rhizocola hellebori TaxID=1392758 RepID=A0A8J3VIZ2_9ACTN|nr:hypothetical protein Rhe02_61620 [Rhizocola hellebori]